MADPISYRLREYLALILAAIYEVVFSVATSYVGVLFLCCFVLFLFCFLFFVFVFRFCFLFVCLVFCFVLFCFVLFCFVLFCFFETMRVLS